MSTALAASLSFTVPLPPVALRRNRETTKHAWRAKLKDEYSEQVWCEGANVLWDGRRRVINDPWEKAHLTLVWRHHRVGPDHDNALASCKALIDTLTTKGRRPLGIVVDDSPVHLTVNLTTQKVETKAEEGILVTVERR